MDVTQEAAAPLGAIRPLRLEREARSTGYWRIFDSDGRFVAVMLDEKLARQFAVAPEAIAELRTLLDDHQRMNPHHEDLCAICRRASDVLDKTEVRS